MIPSHIFVVQGHFPMPSPVDALAAAMAFAEEHRIWKNLSTSGKLPYRMNAKACLRAIAEGTVVGREEIARTLYETWTAPSPILTVRWPNTGPDKPWGSAHKAPWYALADALLALFAEAGR